MMDCYATSCNLMHDRKGNAWSVWVASIIRLVLKWSFSQTFQIDIGLDVWAVERLEMVEMVENAGGICDKKQNEPVPMGIQQTTIGPRGAAPVARTLYPVLVPWLDLYPAIAPPPLQPLQLTPSRIVTLCVHWLASNICIESPFPAKDTSLPVQERTCGRTLDQHFKVTRLQR